MKPEATLFSAGLGRKQLGRFWCECRDGDEAARAIFDRHYSRYRYADGRDPKLFVGPGEKFVLITENADALWVWRKFISGDGQTGVNCAVFRNESPVLSSTLILDAEDIARGRWPDERFFTYVNARAIQSKNPGACFIAAKWKRVGITKWNRLVILAKEPASRCDLLFPDTMNRQILRNLMTPKPALDYLGLQVFTQATAESEQEGGDLEAAKIFGDLHSLVCNAETRAKLRLDVLDEYVTAEEVEKTKEVLDDSVSGEIVIIATILRTMAEATEEHANDLRADGATFRADDADRRAGQYRALYDAAQQIFDV